MGTKQTRRYARPINPTNSRESKMNSILVYWQNNQAAAHWMMRACIDDGDYLAAISWQQYAAHCYRCFVSNSEIIARG